MSEAIKNFATLVLCGVGIVIVYVLTRLSTDAIGVIVGVALALAGTVPMLAVVAWLAGRSAAQPPPQGLGLRVPPEELYYQRSAPVRRLPYGSAPVRRRAPPRRYVEAPEPPRLPAPSSNAIAVDSHWRRQPVIYVDDGYGDDADDEFDLVTDYYWD